MEIRKITVVSTVTQAKNVVETAATTLRELKEALRNAHIPFDGMTFYEGLSHTEMLTDDAVLPHDIMYRGAPTNELVFMLTVPNKKINSGSDLSEARVALYDAIRSMHLEGDCIAKFGKNFTQCKNSELMSLIEEHDSRNESAKEESSCECCGCSDELFKIKTVLSGVIAALVVERNINPGFGSRCIAILGTDVSKADKVFGFGEEKKDESPYSNDEINDMFGFLG